MAGKNKLEKFSAEWKEAKIEGRKKLDEKVAKLASGRFEEEQSEEEK